MTDFDGVLFNVLRILIDDDGLLYELKNLDGALSSRMAVYYEVRLMSHDGGAWIIVNEAGRAKYAELIDEYNARLAAAGLARDDVNGDGWDYAHGFFFLTKKGDKVYVPSIKHGDRHASHQDRRQDPHHH